MKLSVVLVVCVVLCCAMAAEAYTLPVVVTAGNITVGCSRTPNVVAGYDEVDFYLTGMLGRAAGLNTDGTQCRINIIEGRWTADSSGAFWIPSSLANLQTYSGNHYWEQNPPTSSHGACTVNFETSVYGATIWTNNAGGGGRGPQSSGQLYNYFSGNWYSNDSEHWTAGDLVYPPSSDYATYKADMQAQGKTVYSPDSTYLASLYVTHATPDTGIAYGNTLYSPGASGKMSFTYGDGTVETVAFYTKAPEPCMLALLSAGLIGLTAYAWRRRQ